MISVIQDKKEVKFQVQSANYDKKYCSAPATFIAYY